MSKAREIERTSARIVVHAPVRANRSPRRVAADLRLCTLHRTARATRLAPVAAARCAQPRGRRARTPHCARRRTSTSEGGDVPAPRVSQHEGQPC